MDAEVGMKFFDLLSAKRFSIGFRVRDFEIQSGSWSRIDFKSKIMMSESRNARLEMVAAHSMDGGLRYCWEMGRRLIIKKTAINAAG
jgi:hypothetical protein